VKVLFLGTSAGRPTRVRNVTSIALQLTEPSNGFWLFDAGEGTQHRLMETKLKLNKLEKIFITHLHGDHLYGLPGLLSSRSYFDGAGPLQLYGPPGIKAYLEAVFLYSSSRLNYELTIIEVDSGCIMNDAQFKITAAPLEHRVPCFGYRIEEADRQGHLDLPYLERMGVKPGPVYGKLKRGEDVQLPDGPIIKAIDAVGPAIAGRTLTILGDTCPCDNGVELAKSADLLIHEATFETGLEEKALMYGHSTVKQAVDIALAAGVNQLALTHFSSRYDDEMVAAMIEEEQKRLPDIVAARDYLELPVPSPYCEPNMHSVQ